MEPYRVFELDGAYSGFAPELNQPQLAALDHCIARLEARGPLIAQESKKSLKVQGHDKLYELRAQDVRMFYCFLPGQAAVLLLGVVKDQPKLRGEVYAKAAKMCDEVQQMGSLEWQRLTQLS